MKLSRRTFLSGLLATTAMVPAVGFAQRDVGSAAPVRGYRYLTDPDAWYLIDSPSSPHMLLVGMDDWRWVYGGKQE